MSDIIVHRVPDGEGFIVVSAAKGTVTELGGEKTPLLKQIVLYPLQRLNVCLYQ